MTIYLIVSLVVSVAQLLNRNRIACRVLIGLFLASQISVTLFAASNIGLRQGGYFAIDGLGVLLAIVVGIVSSAAFCHSRRYIVENEEGRDDRVRAQYYGAMSALTMALTMTCFSSHLAVTWIFVEVTTLSASALIFYRRTAESVEATWKYVFACSVSLVLVYVGILLTSISQGPDAGLGLSFDVLRANASSLDPTWLQMAFIFIFVGAASLASSRCSPRASTPRTPPPPPPRPCSPAWS